MKYMGLNEIREAYLNFFEGKEHLRMNSFSLVPKNDNSLLLINAGMAPLKPYFTGLQTPPRRRVTTCQKCIRTGDIENVGKTSRHGTFFEMLGNFSFGDYFKKEVIPWAWEFITKVLEIPKDKLYVTIYKDDDEAFDIWTKSTDVDPKRIFRLDKEENFWEIGQGPCGPCSEIHFDRGDGKITNEEDFLKAADEDRVVEFWNLVFTQFDKDKEGNYNKLEHPNIDTGMGLERIATIMQEKDNIFEVDTIKNILSKIGEISGVKYGENETNDISLRIITDHVRGTTFMISDGILPSNEGRGYVLRRLLRRASRHGKLLGIQGTFLTDICDVVINDCKSAYPELEEKKDYIKKVIKLEEERFKETIDSGIEILNDYIKELKETNSKVLTGEKSFKLYDTYGFPIELTEEILEEEGISVDKDGFNKEMQKQRERARSARSESNYMGTDRGILDEIPAEIETNFDGYNKLSLNAQVKMIILEDEVVSTIKKDQKGIIITNNTPFYAEMGGQVGDNGIIFNDKFKANVKDCKKNVGGKILHFVEVLDGSLSTNDEVTLEVSSLRRNNICKNHSATHMLQEALKEVLGDHVSQSGSYVDDERMRFDFTHFSALNEKEIKKVELIVNKKIMESMAVHTDVMDLNEAKSSGAVALFDDKYSDKVRVVNIGSYSKELCGGTHVRNSGEIGLFQIVSESGVAAGIRRIEALTGLAAINYLEEKKELIKNVSLQLKCGEKDILNRIQVQSQELKEKDKEISSLKSKLSSGIEDEILNNAKDIKGIKVIAAALKDFDSESLRNLGDKLKSKLGEGVVILGSSTNDKVQFIAMATKEAVQKGIHCGKIIKEVASIAGGGGGGRPDMAQAGGKLPEKLKEAIDKIPNILDNLVK